MKFAGFDFHGVFFVDIAVFQCIFMSVQGVVVDVDFGVERQNAVVGGDHERIDLQHVAVFLYETLIEIDDEGVTLSDDEKAQYIRVLNNYLDAFIPKTLHEKFFEYQGKAKFSGKGKMLLRFERIDSLGIDKYYELLVDTDKWRLSGLRVRQIHEPRIVKGKFLYIRKEGHWMVAETISSFIIDGQKYSEKTEYTYKNIKSFWLINKVRQTVQQDGHDILLHRFKIVDYKINLMN